MSEVNAAQQMLGTPSASNSGRGVPLEHMDYDYIRDCSNIKELEKIFKALKSGTEGYYPDLVEFCEKRIMEVAPKSKVLRKEAKPATEYDLGREEWTKLKSDVEEWADDMSKLGKGSLESGADTLPPVRNRGTINMAGKKDESGSQAWGQPSNDRIRGSDYREWDKYDAEAEADRLEDNVPEKSVKKEAEKLSKSRSIGVKDVIDTSGMSDREREMAANREKDKGNEAFRSSDYKEAIHYYTRSLSVVPSAPAFNNRSLARIKMGEFEGAVEDCTEVLELEPTNIKALLRRGTARKSLKDYKLALQDLQAVLKVEANNKQALDMVNDVVTKMEKEQTQIEEELKKKRSSDCSKEQPLTNGDNNQTKKGRRLVIQEVEEEEDEEERDGGMEQEEKGMKEEETNTAEKDKREAEPGAEKAASPGNPQLAAGEGNPPKAASEENTQTSGQESSGKSETDGSTASKPESAAPPPAAIPTPSPPKAAPPPLPQAVVSLKNAGNDFYAKGQYGDANKQYSKAITRLEKEKGDHSAGLAALYSNRASCGLKSGSPRDCVADCNTALQLNPAGVKTYMKRAKAYEDMEKYGHAYVDFRSAANYDNYNTNAQNDASRMMKILKDQHGHEWRDKLPSKPKSPSFPQPVYTTPPPPTNAPLTTTTITTAGSSPQPHPAPVPSRTQPPPQPEAKPCPDAAAEESEKKAPPQSSKTPPTNTAPPTKSKKAEPANQATPPPKQATPSSKQAPPPAASKEERFQQFKAQGNDLVKKGQYSQAIGCYTRSIEVDPTQAVSYSNRALCYLKLNLPSDAIEDCNEALKRDPSSIKALYRRGQARRMVGSFPESAKDLTELLKIDPNNVAAKKELDAVKDAWRKDLREKQSKASNQTAGKGKAGGDGEGTTKTKKPGRRVQIQEVNNSSEEETESAPRHKKPAAKTSGSTTAPPGASEGQQGKAAAAPSPVAEKGGQKAKEGGKTKEAKTGKENKPASSPASGTPKAKKITAYEFMQEWTSLKKKKNVGAYAALLKQVPPNDIPKVLSNKLDGDMLSGILSAAADHLAASDAVFTFQLLNKLPSVDRFKTVKMFLSKMDKDNMQRCLNMISSLPDVCKEEDIKKLKKVYGM